MTTRKNTDAKDQTTRDQTNEVSEVRDLGLDNAVRNSQVNPTHDDVQMDVLDDE